MPRSVVRTFSTLSIEVGILHELLIDCADGFHWYETKVVCPESQCHLASFHVMAAQEIAKNVEMNLTGVPLFISHISVKHCPVEFALELAKKLSIKEAFGFLNAGTI